MIWLILGIASWSAVHFIPTLGRRLRDSAISRIGSIPYQLLFSGAVLASLAMMVIGWRSTPEVLLYTMPDWSRPVGFLLMIVAFVLFGAAKHETSIKRVIRHPQLVSILLWALAHLITSGSTRALVLFGGLAAWALVEILLINAREGAYSKPPAPGWKIELRGLAISIVIFVVALFLHPYFAGVSPIPR